VSHRNVYFRSSCILKISLIIGLLLGSVAQNSLWAGIDGEGLATRESQPILGSSEMSSTGHQILRATAIRLKSAIENIYYKKNGYLALILREFCSEYYGTMYTGGSRYVMRTANEMGLQGSNVLDLDGIINTNSYYSNKVSEILQITRNCTENRPTAVEHLEAFWKTIGDEVAVYLGQVIIRTHYFEGRIQQDQSGDFVPVSSNVIQIGLMAYRNIPLEAFVTLVANDTNAFIAKISVDPAEIFDRTKKYLELQEE